MVKGRKKEIDISKSKLSYRELMKKVSDKVAEEMEKNYSLFFIPAIAYKYKMKYLPPTRKKAIIKRVAEETIKSFINQILEETLENEKKVSVKYLGKFTPVKYEKYIDGRKVIIKTLRFKRASVELNGKEKPNLKIEEKE